MSETMVMWTEIIFNLSYLAVVWALVLLMARRQGEVAAADQPVTRLFILAFALLALGDTGHVGFRVLAYALGGLDSSVTLFGATVGLVGLGALATAFTVTLFYGVMLLIWQRHYAKPLGWFGLLLIAAAVARLLLMIPAANDWNAVVPPPGWSLLRNAPLVIQGLGVAYLILRDARKTGDRPFLWIGISILVSYAFYTPVILWVQQVPMLGMLMIPKTLAYVAIAVIAYRTFYTRRAAASSPARSGAAGR